MVRFKNLFKPITIRNLEIKNRIVMAPFCTLYGNADGSVSRKLINYYRERAKGGAGLIIVEFAHIDDKGSKGLYTELGIHHDSMLPGLSELSDTIKLAGARAGIQIAHSGSQKIFRTPPLVAPSPIPWEATEVVPRELTLEEIEEIVNAYGEAARRAKQAGFEFVEVHGAHGYLIAQFLSSNTNRRTDKYGGPLENRMRFALEVARNVRDKVGDEFPVGFRINGDDFVEGGITLEDAKLIAKELEKVGVEVIHVSAGTFRSRERRVTPLYLPPANNIYLAEEIKKAITIPVIASGSINDPQLAEEALRDGKVDMVSMARPLFADPYLPKKAQDGRVMEIIPCIRCNDGCAHRATLGRTLLCTVNPETGREEEYRIRPADKKKDVVVIGAGPAGMEAAAVAALRGHDVTLYDKDEALGGQLIPGALPPFKRELRRLLDFYVHRLERLPIKILLNTEVTARMVKEIGPDVAIVATGTILNIPEVPGIDKPFVFSTLQVLREKPKIKVEDTVVVVGGGLVGAETAWFLAEQNKKITLISRRNSLTEIANNVEPIGRSVLMKFLSKLGVKVVLGVKLDQILDGGVTIIDRNWRKSDIEAGTVVLASGFRPDKSLWSELQSMGIESYAVGDCVQPRNILNAIHEGSYTSREI